MVLFDLDGTLTDSRPGILRCVQHALKALGRPVPPEDELLWCIGPPLLDSFATMLGDRAVADRALSLYRERFSTVGLYENRLYDGIAPLLEALDQRGLELHVATSKPHVVAGRIVRHFGIDRHFKSVFGAELSGERGDKTELLGWVLETTGADPANVTMIGDRAHDMIGARNNGLDAVGVLYGYGTERELKESGARTVAASPADLLELFV